MTEWTIEDVAARFEEAASTARRLPPVRVQGYFNCWPEIKRICQERDILLVMDEVICGFGRTGNWFGCETYDLEPDLLTFAKGVTNR